MPHNANCLAFKYDTMEETVRTGAVWKGGGGGGREGRGPEERSRRAPVPIMDRSVVPLAAILRVAGVWGSDLDPSECLMTLSHVD